jgi:MoaA/NifB/PqqE/SkfB family radical SAM enzyme
MDISTNASLITEEIAERLSEMHLEYVHVSLDACTDDVQSSVRGK